MQRIEEIMERVSTDDVLMRYWTEADRNGRYKCCFHNGEDNNMVSNGKFCHCFVCGKNDTAIGVVKAIFNVPTSEAIKKIDDDFNLGLFKPLTKQEKQKYAEKRRMREREQERKKQMGKFEKECLDEIAEKLRKADEFIREKAFKGEVGSEEMFAYADSLDFVLFKRAVERKRWLEWLWNVITEDTQYMLDDDFVKCYGTDKVDILRKLYVKKIVI